MPRIENDIKLDFKDVLIRPKRSTLKSRAQVDLNRTFIFKHSKLEWTGVPVMAANMDTVGTFEIAKVFGEFKMFTCIHKHYTVDEWVAFARANPELLNYIAASAGTSESDFDKLAQIMNAVDIKFICLDVANGYSEHVSYLTILTHSLYIRLSSSLLYVLFTVLSAYIMLHYIVCQSCPPYPRSLP